MDFISRCDGNHPPLWSVLHGDQLYPLHTGPNHSDTGAHIRRFHGLLFLGEGMEHLQVLGGAVVVGAILLLQVQREQDEIAPDLIRTQRS